MDGQELVSGDEEGKGCWWSGEREGERKREQERKRDGVGNRHWQGGVRVEMAGGKGWGWRLRCKGAGGWKYIIKILYL